VFTLLRGAKNEHDTRGFNIAAIRSTDHGATWSKREIIISDFRRGIVVDPDDAAPHRTGDINPEAVVDPTSGAAYVVWQDNRFGPRSSIAFSQSLDGGLTWSSPIRVNQTRRRIRGSRPATTRPSPRWSRCWTTAPWRSATTTSATTPPMPAPPPRPTRSWPTATPPAPTPTSWGNETRVTDASFDSRKAPVARGFFLGDYEGLGSDGSAVFPFFTMTHGTDPASVFVRKVGP
jgi:hypothetical protein